MSTLRRSQTSLVLWAVLFGLTSTSTRAGSNRSGLVINEVVFHPAAPAQPVQVELLNRASKSIDVSGYCLLDQDRNAYVLPPLPLMPPAAFVVVQFWPSLGRQERNVLTFAKGVVWLQCRAEWAGKAFRGNENECALYSRAGQDAGDMQDFVRWGRRPRSNPAPASVAQAQAIERGLWAAGQALYVADPAPGDEAPVQPGGSIAWRRLAAGRFARPEWFIYAPRDVSIGSPNPYPIPVPFHPWPNAGFSLEGEMKFLWRDVSNEYEGFRVQVARDDAFKDTVLDKCTTEAVPALALKPGKYYWRVRHESGKDTGEWCSSVVFEILKE